MELELFGSDCSRSNCFFSFDCYRSMHNEPDDEFDIDVLVSDGTHNTTASVKLYKLQPGINLVLLGNSAVFLFHGKKFKIYFINLKTTYFCYFLLSFYNFITYRKIILQTS